MSRGNESSEIESVPGSARTSISVSERPEAFFPSSHAVVVADHESNGRLPRKRNVQLSRGALHLRCVGGDRSNGLVEVEICASSGAADEHQRGDSQPYGETTHERRPRAR